MTNPNGFIAQTAADYSLTIEIVTKVYKNFIGNEFYKELERILVLRRNFVGDEFIY
jgi:hypothetical protein